jgi:hypothetical protein
MVTDGDGGMIVVGSVLLVTISLFGAVGDTALEIASSRVIAVAVADAAIVDVDDASAETKCTPPAIASVVAATIPPIVIRVRDDEDVVYE